MEEKLWRQTLPDHPEPLLIDCVTLGKLFHRFETHFSHPSSGANTSLMAPRFCVLEDGVIKTFFLPQVTMTPLSPFPLGHLCLPIQYRGWDGAAIQLHLARGGQLTQAGPNSCSDWFSNVHMTQARPIKVLSQDFSQQSWGRIILFFLSAQSYQVISLKLPVICPPSIWVM